MYSVQKCVSSVEVIAKVGKYCIYIHTIGRHIIILTKLLFSNY